MPTVEITITGRDATGGALRSATSGLQNLKNSALETGEAMGEGSVKGEGLARTMTGTARAFNQAAVGAGLLPPVLGGVIGQFSVLGKNLNEVSTLSSGATLGTRALGLALGAIPIAGIALAAVAMLDFSDKVKNTTTALRELTDKAAAGFGVDISNNLTLFQQRLDEVKKKGEDALGPLDAIKNVLTFEAVWGESYVRQSERIAEATAEARNELRELFAVAQQRQAIDIQVEGFDLLIAREEQARDTRVKRRQTEREAVAEELAEAKARGESTRDLEASLRAHDRALKAEQESTKPLTEIQKELVLVRKEMNLEIKTATQGLSEQADITAATTKITMDYKPTIDALVGSYNNLQSSAANAATSTVRLGEAEAALEKRRQERAAAFTLTTANVPADIFTAARGSIVNQVQAAIGRGTLPVERAARVLESTLPGGAGGRGVFWGEGARRGLQAGGIVGPPGGVFRLGEGGEREVVSPLGELVSLLRQALGGGQGGPGVQVIVMLDGEEISSRMEVRRLARTGAAFR